jgi:hypothetical protein
MSSFGEISLKLSFFYTITKGLIQFISRASIDVNQFEEQSVRGTDIANTMIDYVVAVWNLLDIAYPHNSRTQFLLHACYMYKIIEVTTDKIFHDRRDGVIIMFCNKIRAVKTLSN